MYAQWQQAVDIFHHNCYSDVNECLTDNGGCNQTCTNTQGSYVCSCIGQYTLDDNQHDCIGIMHSNKSLMIIIFFNDHSRTSANCSHFCWQWHGNFLYKMEYSNTESFKCTSGSYTQLLQYQPERHLEHKHNMHRHNTWAGHEQDSDVLCISTKCKDQVCDLQPWYEWSRYVTSQLWVTF